jgi:F-type H+-transporting ATPase subunit b
VRRLALIAVFGFTLGIGALAQQPAPSPEPNAINPVEEEKGIEVQGHLEAWKWANFLILVGVLGWMISKSGPAFFRRRTEEIQRGISEAGKLKQEAEARAAKVEMRMASLQSEIEHVRADAKTEMEKEAARIRQETGQYIARIQDHGEQEISAHSRHIEKELRAYAAQLAIELAGQRIRTRMSGDTQNVLVDGFLEQLDRQSSTEARL